MKPAIRPGARLRPIAGVVAALSFAALASLACGSPLVGAECEPPGCGESECKVDADCTGGRLCTGGACVAKAECTFNADCGKDRVCVAGACKTPNECVVDLHCPCDQGFCIEGHCKGGPKDCNAPPTTCALNADCGPYMYCVDRICRTTLECLKHADCKAGEACYQSVCYAL